MCSFLLSRIEHCSVLFLNRCCLTIPDSLAVLCYVSKMAYILSSLIVTNEINDKLLFLFIPKYIFYLSEVFSEFRTVYI